MEDRNYWIVRSSEEDESDPITGGKIHFRVGEHVIEAETGEDAVEIAREFLIGQFKAHNYVPKFWRLIGESAWEQVLMRARGQGGAVHYKTEDGVHKTRTEEEIIKIGLEVVKIEGVF